MQLHPWQAWMNRGANTWDVNITFFLIKIKGILLATNEYFIYRRGLEWREMQTSLALNVTFSYCMFCISALQDYVFHIWCIVTYCKITYIQPNLNQWCLMCLLILSGFRARGCYTGIVHCLWIVRSCSVVIISKLQNITNVSHWCLIC